MKNDKLQGKDKVLHEESFASDAEKLRLLADWFDMYDSIRENKNNEVQRDLRRIASNIAEPGAHTLLVNLYRARKERDKAKKALKELREKIGICTVKNMNNDNCFFEVDLPFERWCDVCKQKQPVWEKYHEASNKAGAALRACLKYGKEQEDK